MIISTGVYYVFVIMGMMIKTSVLLLSRCWPRDILGSKELQEHTEATKYDPMEIFFLSGPDSMPEAGVQTTLPLHHSIVTRSCQIYLLTVHQVHPSLPSLPGLESLFSLIGMWPQSPNQSPCPSFLYLNLLFSYQSNLSSYKTLKSSNLV